MNKLGNGGKGIGWNTDTEVEQPVGRPQRGAEEGRGAARIVESDIDAAVILMLAPETNGHVAVKAWAVAPANKTGRDHAPGAAAKTRRSASATSGAAAQDHLLADLVGIESEKRSATTQATPTCTS